MQYIIRKATEQDLTRAREIYGIARNTKNIVVYVL